MDKKVLLIEDDDFIRDIYLTELNDSGIPTDGFATGQEGYEALIKNDYELVLLDIMLPDTNGIDILKKIKTNMLTKDIGVVMLTNLGQDSIQKEAQTLGAKGYLIKLSFTPDQIVQEVKKFLTT